MRVMAIDASTESCSVALWNGNTLFSQFEKCKSEQSNRILPLVESVLNNSNITLGELNALSYCRGPGSFTGVRITVGIAQGLALGAKLPVVGVSTLVTMAQGAWRKKGVTRVLAAIDARMGEVYWAKYIRDKYNLWHGEETESILKFDAVTKQMEQLFGEWAIVGNGWTSYPEMSKNSSRRRLKLVNADILFPEAKDALPIAFRMMNSGYSLSVENAIPVYLRNKIAKKKSNKHNYYA